MAQIFILHEWLESKYYKYNRKVAMPSKKGCFYPLPAAPRYAIIETTLTGQEGGMEGILAAVKSWLIEGKKSLPAGCTTEAQH